ncbi:T9SS type A sorting domain-containing protein, partial [Candidatus Desantisbacteria bacterium]|nr:T9SS type A sorting domain-containing protein [Candidatus Desantisbacteria bacterium]
FIFGVGWNNILFSYGTVTEKVSDGRIIKDGIYRYGADQNGKTGYIMDRYKDNPVMKPWEGCWLYSSMSGNLRIPAIPSQPLAALAPELLQDPRDWEVKLSVFTDKSIDRDNYFGIAGDANDGYNKYCLFEPPNGYPPYVSMYFPIDNHETLGKFACVYKSPLVSNSPKVWDFEVLTDGMQNTDVTLQWQGIPDSCTLCLLDLATDKKIDMRQVNSYTYGNGTERIRRFQVVAVAAASEIRAASGIYAWHNQLTVNGIPPDEFTFENLPLNSVIKIYTLSGELIATINNNTWAARNNDSKIVASGIYFYVVEDGGNVRKTGKLAVIR